VQSSVEVGDDYNIPHWMNHRSGLVFIVWVHKCVCVSTGLFFPLPSSLQYWFDK
jgi:hypothetical protein